MKTTILAYAIALGGVAMIAVGFGLIGIAQALRLLLVIFADSDVVVRAMTIEPLSH
jgi:hypothetical protein